MKLSKQEYRTTKRVDKIKRVLSKRQPDLTIVLENVHDAHNVSAVLRSCDAVGIHTVQLLYYGDCEFPDLSKRSSASAKKWVEQRKFSSVEECFSVLRSEGFSIYVTALGKDSQSIYDMDFTQKIALVFGNEHSGVSQEAIHLSDGNVLIPQVGMIQSLNISVACAVTLFEAFRQRLKNGIYDATRFSEDEYSTIVKEWSER
ncbi:MAG TPA: TrmH family RNA methyltransferase [Candidatus Kapabacteria bacterium]|nr:RNA methyltransferase [Ignavibacteria bacterium]HRE59186.1 TrmH family RNA methyltransferase [Candidatus Kapabacteria bacterium]HRK59449.1 TrmH family RNA methyltransferase [Candidatus Kapabacteria bacterium]